MDDSTLYRHELDFLGVAEKPSPQALAVCYGKTCYQSESANYRNGYSALENEEICLRIAQRAAFVSSKPGPRAPDSQHDMGYREGFVGRHFRKLGWQVGGIHSSRAGVEPMNPDYASFVQQGDCPIYLDPGHEGPNYVVGQSRGPAAHQVRRQLERRIGMSGVDAANRFHETLAYGSLSRDIRAYQRPQPERKMT